MTCIEQGMVITTTPRIGQPFAGGYFAGRYFQRGEERALILADRIHETGAKLWDAPGPRHHARGAEDHMDGLANTKALAEAGSTIARKVLESRIGGFSGWHIPARDQLLVIQINLLSLPDFDRYGPQSMAGWGKHGGYGQYWSSTMVKAGSAWYMHMLPWCGPSTNWANKGMGIRPVRSVPIIHEPDATELPSEERIVDRIAIPRHSVGQIETVLERFINEDSGRFYGRTGELARAIAELAEGG